MKTGKGEKRRGKEGRMEEGREEGKEEKERKEEGRKERREEKRRDLVFPQLYRIGHIVPVNTHSEQNWSFGHLAYHHT